MRCSKGREAIHTLFSYEMRSSSAHFIYAHTAGIPATKTCSESRAHGRRIATGCTSLRREARHACPQAHCPRPGYSRSRRDRQRALGWCRGFTRRCKVRVSSSMASVPASLTSANTPVRMTSFTWRLTLSQGVSPSVAHSTASACAQLSGSALSLSGSAHSVTLEESGTVCHTGEAATRDTDRANASHR